YRGGDSSPEGRNEGWSSFQDDFDKRSPRYEDNEYETQPSHHSDDDGSMVMRNVHEGPKERHFPYSFRGNGRRVRWRREGNICVTVWGNGKPVMRKMRENTQDGAQGSWFKVTIPHGKKYDKIWLMNSIQSLCSVCFTPVDFHYVKNGARFFVQKASTASALMDVSYKIYDEENQKIPIFVNPSAVPYSVRNKLRPEKMEKLKLAFNKRFDVSQQSLDLQKLRFDPNLMGHDIEIILNRRNCMAAALQIIKKNFPEEKAGFLESRGQKLATASVQRASCGRTGRHYNLELSIISSLFLVLDSAVIECFPKLLRLDGQELPSTVVTD
ncbi:PREDICTED: nuclear RNA export factor 2-like, partial [Bison bison bison]|uniref:Nuclear RNA export factor 2-like n=1 Tax=Bison bison bison TaxID=43346 RepID=A0A6P3IQN0_BISBB